MTAGGWSRDQGGALEWGGGAQNAIIDTTGEVRWFMNTDPIHDQYSVLESGPMLGFEQNKDGAYTWGFGQRYLKYDIMGRKIWNRRLPQSYIDFSHALCAAENGNYFLRVAAAAYARPDGKTVRTVRDVIVEVDESGNVVDDWRLWEILDSYRDNVIKTMDQGAVCLNIDFSKEGQTLSAADLAAMDKSDRFGDIAGVGSWPQLGARNSMITIRQTIRSFSRYAIRSAVVKIGREPSSQMDSGISRRLAAVRGKIRSLSLSMPLDKYSKLKVRPVKAASTGPGRSIRLSASTKNQPRM